MERKEKTLIGVFVAAMAGLAIAAVAVTDSRDLRGSDAWNAEAPDASKPCAEAGPDERCSGPAYQPRRPVRGRQIIAGCVQWGGLSESECRAYFDHLPAKYEIWERQRGTDAAAACLELAVKTRNKHRACGSRR